MPSAPSPCSAGTADESIATDEMADVDRLHSDFSHYRLTDGAGAEIICWFDSASTSAAI
jgi:hypothetical protein